MGTVGYMSPEQVRGAAVDHRTDIFSFGSILYEMLAGQRAFQRDTTAETLTAILKEEPPELTALGKTIAPSLVRVAEHCLEKRPELRFQSAKDLAFALEALSGSNATIASAVVQPGRPSWRRWLPWSVAAVAVVVAAFETVAAYRGHSTAGQTSELRLQVVTAGSTYDVTLSPDGRQLVSGGDNEGDPLWLRPLDSEVAKPLPGTESGGATFWSPDSKSIGFVVGEKLKRIDLATGAIQTLADAPVERGSSWNREGTILFAPGGNGPLYRVPATGGQPVQVTRLRTPQEASHRFPQFLPDGRHFLFWIVGSPDVEGEYVASLDNPDHHRICVADGPVTFAPPDHILLVRESVLYAQRFDPDQMMVTSEPVAVASGVSADRIYRTRVAASDTGIIAFRPDVSVKRQATWLDRTGRPDGTVGDPLAGVRGGELSPDGNTLVIHTARGEVGKPDELLMDMARGTLTPLTSERSGNARWSPDGKRIAFNGERTGILNIYSMVVGSSTPGDVVLALNEAINLSDWSPDGKYILYSTQSPATARDVWAVPLEGADRKPFPVVQTPAEERSGRFSPDSKWVSYSSNETGREEIFVRPFPGRGPALRVSTEGGRLPFWRRDGKELYYLGGGQLMAVGVSGAAKGALEIGMPQSLFKTRGIVVPESDGRRFLVLTPLGEVGTPPVSVIVNWVDERK
jgi:Tol biopolymer transport system component